MKRKEILMPKETFFRLPQEKQERILEAALDEFSTVTFTEASINRIIQKAGIPRGSFYQYFDNKEDLYQFIIGRMSEEKRAIYQETQERMKEGFFEAVEACIPGIFRWAAEHPKYYRLGYLVTRDHSEFIQNLLVGMESGRDWMYQLLVQEQKEGKIRDDRNLDVLIDMYLAMGNRLLELYYERSQEEASAYMKEMLRFLKYGIYTDSGEEAG